MKNLFVSMITFNGAPNTIECLKSLDNISMDGMTVHVIVIDNASDTVFSLEDQKFNNLKITIIRNEENKGFSGGHNVGIQYALDHDADYIVILNNDTLVDSDVFTQLCKIADTSNEIGIVTPKIYFAKGFEFHKSRYQKEELGKVIWYAGGKMDWNNVLGFHRGVDEIDYGQYDKLEQTEFASGCCLLIKPEVIKKIGMFDERYFLYYEDIDLNERVKKAKYTIMYVPTAVIWHKNAASAGGSGSPLQDYYITRNRLLLGMTYAQSRTKLALLRESLNILLYGRSWQRRGVIDFYRRKLGKGSYRA